MKQNVIRNLAIVSSLLMAGNLSAQNPIIQTMYTPDPAPYVYNDTVYLFVDHDEDDAQYFSMKDWLLYTSADMVNWTYKGAQVSTATFSWAKQGDRAWAQQAVHKNGKWYWYVCCNTAQGGDALAVAVADSPTGPWKDAIGGPLATGWGYIDPTVFIDDDGKAYLFWGNKGLWYGELNDDMISFKDGYKEVPGYHDPKSFGELQSKMNWQKGENEMMTQFEEAPWVTKRNGIYYMSYAAGGVPEYMGYSTAPTIHGPWTFRGRIMDEAINSFTIHGGDIEFKGRNFMFYHNGLLPNGEGFRRSSSVEEFTFNEDGSFPFIPFTKEGVKEPICNLNPYNRVEAETIAFSYGLKNDRLAGTHHYITSIHTGDWIKVRAVDFGQEGAPKSFLACVASEEDGGLIEVRLDALNGNVIATVKVPNTGAEDAWKEVEAQIRSRRPIKGVHDVYFLFRGGDKELYNFDYWMFRK